MSCDGSRAGIACARAQVGEAAERLVSRLRRLDEVRGSGAQGWVERLHARRGARSRLLLRALRCPSAAMVYITRSRSRTPRTPPPQVLPRYQRVASQLYELLRVRTLDEVVPAAEALVEAVQRMQGAHAPIAPQLLMQL